MKNARTQLIRCLALSLTLITVLGQTALAQRVAEKNNPVADATYLGIAFAMQA